MDDFDIPPAFWDILRDITLEEREDTLDWHPDLPDGLTDVLEVAEPDVTFGRMVHFVGDPASATVAYTHVVLHHGLLAMRVYFPARPVAGGLGIPAYLVGFRDLPQVRRMYRVDRVLARLQEVSDARSAYGQAVSAATVQQAMRALSGLAQLERMPFTLFPLRAA